MRHDLPVHEIIAAQAARTPDSTALRCGSLRLTYRDLDSRAAALSGVLRTHGAGPGKLAGIFLDRSLDMVVALLALLKSGAAYVPLDPQFQAARLSLMLEDARPPVILTNRRLRERLPRTTAHVLCVEEAALAGACIPRPVSPGEAAYVLYTSGSTGRPKGVVVTHANLDAFFHGMDLAIGTGPGDVWLAVTSICFDISGLELLWTLARGCEVVIAPDGFAAREADPATLIRSHGITHLQCTPSLARMLLSDPGSAAALGLLDTLLVGGEALPLPLAQSLANRVRGRIFNMYGPTETTIWSTCWQVPASPHRVLIGGPIAGTEIYVLDESMHAVPDGETGELYIGGAGVARGYLNRPELTSERFVQNPFRSDRDILYRTGDRVRVTPTGDLEILGRLDQQVKIRGHRVELGEVEAALQACAGIREAAATAADSTIVAYVAPEPGSAATEAEWRRELARVLPEYMLPSQFQVLEELPRLPNRKLDRNALRAIPQIAPGTRPVNGANGSCEEAIAAIWRKALNVPSVGLDDRFFDLGGHSLLMVEVYEQVRDTLAPGLSIVDMFEFPTVRMLSARIRGASPSLPCPERPAREARSRWHGGAA